MSEEKFVEFSSLCRSAVRGERCAFGKGCKFSHDKKDIQAFRDYCKECAKKPCEAMIRNNECKYGAKCRYSHAKKIVEAERFERSCRGISHCMSCASDEYFMKQCIACVRQVCARCAFYCDGCDQSQMIKLRTNKLVDLDEETLQSPPTFICQFCVSCRSMVFPPCIVCDQECCYGCCFDKLAYRTLHKKDCVNVHMAELRRKEEEERAKLHERLYGHPPSLESINDFPLLNMTAFA